MKWKLTFLVIILALPGVVAVSWLALPMLVDASTIPVPLETLQVVTAVQSAFLVVVAAVAGVLLAPKIGLSAPVLSAVVGFGRVVDALTPQLLPGVVGGCIGAAVIVGFYAFAPESLAAIQPEQPLPLPVRVLYGGITEEVLIRWGLMTAIAWVGWRIFQKGSLSPSSSVLWVSIVVSALIFGLLHVPVVMQSLPAVPAPLIAYVTIGNGAFGMVAGYLFWRYGLEAAFIAHSLAHVFTYMIRG